MAETKEEITAERDRLRADNAALRAQLAASTGQPPAAVHRFQLSEGDRAELEMHGRANIGGELMTADEVRAKLAETEDQALVVIGDRA
jgi:hypothetical protein